MSDEEQPELPRNLIETARGYYRERFHAEPEAGAVAPGRVEVLGNHTDYNGGYVMSAAIDKQTCVLAGRADGDAVRMSVLEKDSYTEASARDLQRNDDPDHAWSNYLVGVLEQIRQVGGATEIAGMTLGVHGAVPVGAGLSSSAALEVATAMAVQGIYPFELDKMGLALLCQRAENRFVGVNSGLMDQFSSVFGEPEHLLFLDCRTREHQAIAVVGQPVTFVVIDSMVAHALTGGEYNERREECESAARKLGQPQLRDVTLEALEAGRSRLSDVEYRRARHVVTENARVLEARQAVASGDVALLGRLMSQSHASSRDQFENSTPELDRLSEIARTQPGCYGARLTGGGFGGGVLALVEAHRADDIAKSIAEQYAGSAGQMPEYYVFKIAQGAERVPIE